MLKYLIYRCAFACFCVSLVFVGFVIASIESDKELTVVRDNLTRLERRTMDERIAMHKAVRSLEDDNKSLVAKWARAANEVSRLERALVEVNKDGSAKQQPREQVTAIVAKQLSKDIQQRELNFFGRLFGF